MSDGALGDGWGWGKGMGDEFRGGKGGGLVGFWGLYCWIDES